MSEVNSEGLRYLQKHREIAGRKTSLPSYVSEFKRSVLHAWESDPFIPSSIDLQDCGIPFPSIGVTLLMDMKHPNLQEKINGRVRDNPALQIHITPESVQLGAIHLADLEIESPVFVHTGYLKFTEGDKTVFDNGIFTYARGFFGDSSKKNPTYIKLESSSISPNKVGSEKWGVSNPICLYIDGNILAQHRSVFVDPEGISMFPRELGKSFFVLQGIPTQAIIGISTDERSPILLVRHKNRNSTDDQTIEEGRGSPKSKIMNRETITVGPRVYAEPEELTAVGDVIAKHKKLLEQYGLVERESLETEYRRIYSDHDVAMKHEAELRAMEAVLSSKHGFTIEDFKKLRE